MSTRKFTAPLSMHLPETLHEQVRRNHELKIIELQRALEGTSAITLPIAESDVTDLVTDLAGKTPTTRTISTTAPLTGGGDLSADRTFAVSTFGSGASGVVPASGGGTVNFLRADGTWTAAGSSIGVGFYGDGNDGAATMDGSASVAGCTLAGSVYTATRDLFFTSLTVNSGVTLQPSGYRVFCTGTLTVTGKISASGADASGTSGGASTPGAFLGAGTNGGAAGDSGIPATGGGNSAHAPREFATGTPAGGNNSAGTNGGTGQGGGGGDSTGAIGGAAGTTGTTTSLQGTRDIFVATQGHGIGDGTAFTCGTGGGGGRGFTDFGGGGGAGGGWVVVCARTVTGAGTIEAKGGNGANGQGSTDGCGGGGGGGGVVVVVTDSTSAPSVLVTGGTGGNGTGTGFKGGTGGNGISILYHL